MATTRQFEANRINAQKSTGPVTEEGREVSRRNALEHGLAGEGTVVPDELTAAARERKEQWHQRYAPMDGHEEWLFDQIVVNSVRVDFCQTREGGLQGYYRSRADRNWNSDRESDVTELAAKLSKNPERVARKLRGTKQGVEWLLARWDELEAILKNGGCWNEIELSHALDLSGRRVASRERLGGLGTGTRIDDAKQMVAIEVNVLENLLAEALEELDEMDKSAAIRGLETETPRALSLMRRYEAACLKRLQWAETQLQKNRQNGGQTQTAATTTSHSRIEPATIIEYEPVMRKPEEAVDEDAEMQALTYEILSKLPKDSPLHSTFFFPPPSPSPSPSPSPPARVTVEKRAETKPDRSREVSPARPGNRRKRRAAEKLARKGG